MSAGRFRPAQALVTLVLVVALTGCSLSGGSNGRRGGHRGPSAASSASQRPPSATASNAGSADTTTSSVAAKVAEANRRHEYPTPVPGQRVVGGWRDPTAAIRAFATAYINWTAQTVPGRMRALALVSIGQARSAVTLAAAETANDDTLRRGGIGNTGIVEGIVVAAGGRDTFVVVTRERTTATADTAYQGLAAEWHVTLATVTRIASGLWVLSGWQPEN